LADAIEGDPKAGAVYLRVRHSSSPRPLVDAENSIDEIRLGLTVPPAVRERLATMVVGEPVEWQEATSDRKGS
jgi:hypothetical protein